jgi:hypothetical protein
MARENGARSRGLTLQEIVPRRPPRTGVKARRELVEEEKLGIADEGKRDRKLLPLAARQLAYQGVILTR